MRKVLVISYIFPPMGESGVQRTLKFVKYLPDLGWQPLVVCGDDPHIFKTGVDETLLAEVPPHACIWRTRFVSPYALRRRVQQWLGIRGGSEKKGVGSRDEDVGGPEAAVTDKGWRRLLRLVLGALSAPLAPLEFPPVDAGLYWALSIVPLCRRILAHESADLIYSSSFPYSDHVTGGILKRLTGKPWVADFRDPWTQHALGHNRGWRRQVDRFVERLVLQHADRVVGVTPAYTEGLHSLSGKRVASAFCTIENGFDREDFAGERTEPTPADAVVKLAHIGHVYDGTALPLFEALSRLGADGTGLKVSFVGGLAPTEQCWLKEHHISTVLEVEGRVPHARAIEAMQAATALLLLLGDGPRWAGNYPGKLFEYMNCGRPILMVGPEGEAARLVRASGTGCALPAQDVESVSQVLRLLATDPQAFRSRYYHPRPEVIAGYERRALTRRLAAVFDELVSEDLAA